MTRLLNLMLKRMMKYCRLLLLSFFICLPSVVMFSQTKTIDSLKAELERQVDEQKKVKVLNKLGHAFHAINPQDGLSYARKALDISLKSGLQADAANAWLIIGECYFILSDYPRSLEAYQKALSINEEIGMNDGIATDLSNIAVIYQAQSNFPKAVESFQKALKIYEKTANKAGQALILGNIGIIEATLDNSFKAMGYFEQALKMYEELGDKEGISRNLCNIGEIYKNEGKFATAQEYYERALKINNEIQDQRGISILYLNIGETLVKEKKYTDAVGYLEKSVEIAFSIDYKEVVIQAYQDLSDCYSLMGNYKSALEYNRKYINIKESVFNEDNNRKIANLTASYQAEKKEKENEALRERNKLQITYFIVILALVLVILVITYLRYTMKKRTLQLITGKNSEIEKVNINLEALNNELSESNASKDKFFQIISHELLNPIRWINNITEMLPGKIESMTQKELRELAEVLNQAAGHSNKLLENLMQWARLHTGRINFRPEEINVADIINDNINLLGSMTAKKKIRIKTDADGTLTAIADKNMFSTIIRNLLDNAVKFSFDRGEIAISANKTNGSLRVAIADNGVGISVADQAKLFRIDVNYSTLGTANEKGTGFGLILCKEYVEKHGGTVLVESEKGKGSKFTFSIPANPEA